MALALLAALLGALPAAPAAVAAEPQEVSLRLEAVTPGVLDAAGDTTLTLRGTATNTRETPVRNLQLMLWRDQGTLYTAEDQLTDLALAPATLPVGARVFEVETAYTTDLPPVLEPGQSVPFELSATVDQLGLPAGTGAALVGVHARENGSQTVGRVRTLVPVVGTDPDPVDLVSVVQLDAAPSRLAPDLFADDGLGSDLTEGGRLDTLLTSASREGVSWAVDPLLVAEVADLADGYRVAGDEARPGEHAEAARRWLSRLEALPAETGYRLPWGTPDLLAVASHDDAALTDAVVAAQRPDALAATEQLGRVAELPLLVIPVGGGLDAEGLALVERMDPAVVLVSGAEGSAVLEHEDGAALGDVDAAAFTPTIGPEPLDTPPQVVQHLRTRTLMAALQGEQAVVRVVDTADRARAEEQADAGAEWQRRVPLQEWLTTLADPLTDQLTGPAAGAADQLAPDVLADAVRLRSATVAAAELLVDPTVTEDADRVTSTAVSSWWRAGAADQAGRQRWIAPRRAFLDSLLDGEAIALSVPDDVEMSARSGSFPVTVTNRLERAVRVQVLFTSENAQRLTVPPVTGIELAPGQTVTTTASPRARVNGALTARAQLATPSGRAFGEIEDVRIRATQVGRAGWVIVIASGIVLVGGTVLRVRQVRASQRAATTDPGNAERGGDVPQSAEEETRR
ncbi:hypothetical protein DT076_06580 [Desertihabitans brevis]|uniref:Glycoprotein n=1 Tax=Desertihabitans brevis TaxID=2268447 RepID=A0A367YWR7_9ACTN|nr:hypothetical protein DT076_06580 [Desertihabitans brevis]